ncbi:MAG: hypothetical protein ACE145_05280 [Terriglobia bacterium]
MRIGEHTLRDHLRLLAPLFGLITAVWSLRIVLDLAGAPLQMVRVFSVGLAGSLSVLGATFLFHFKRFGSYGSLVTSAFMLVGYGQLLVALAIAFAALTHTHNVFVATEFSFGMTYTQHITSHLTFIFAFQSILAGIMACLLLLMLRWLVPITPKQSSQA